ncbi:hypothetical protein [Lacinutrix sp. Bg11-31]|uniref:hypothetical protein n=1 Tax=Lacinutrix sp. Bg11-31 TaxID=2057808 RepID=UPI000C30D412|nr:hypothetical protein [Lacinutrix sp. Bg11-31]AUC83038.1 hypothetical protein CW733_13240 [Lacinutrix sp. Bg11-31]
MDKNYFFYLLFFLLTLNILSCSKEESYEPNPEEIIEVSPVVFDIENVPYQNLSEYNFFNGTIKNLLPVTGVLPYGLNSSLFSDYAKKKRFIWMPSNVKATYVNDFSPFNFPIGTVLIKNFFYNNVLPENTSKIIETRLMIKKVDGWEFAEYVWNETQTEAALTNESQIINIEWLQNQETKQVDYKIPSPSECFTCHNSYDSPIPIGPKPQNINKDYLYADGTKNQLVKWVEQGFLETGYPLTIETSVNWSDESLPLDLRARSYLDINCAHCHTEGSYCEYRPMRFAYKDNHDLENMGVCVPMETDIGNGLTHIVKPSSPNESVLYFRINSTIEQYRMPLLGRRLIHTEGVRLIEEWIDSLTTPCQ